MKKILTIFVLSLFMFSCSDKTKSNFSTKDLTVTYVTAPLNVPSIIEKENSILKKHLNGVDIKYAEITSGADQSQALASGSVQILNAIGGSSVIASAANGADIKILDIYSRAPKAFALFSKDASLNSPESLKGKTIAGPMGTNLHELLVSYLKSKNLTTNDVNFVNMSIPDALAALSSGKIDVALLGGPAAYKAEKAGLHKITDGEGYIEALICVATTQKYYNEHRDVIDAFLKAQKEILEFMENKPEDTKQIVCKALKLDDAAYTTMFGQYDFNSKVSDKDIEGLQKTADFMFKNKMIKKQINAKDLLIR